jgi:hypothetical protein
MKRAIAVLALVLLLLLLLPGCLRVITPSPLSTYRYYPASHRSYRAPERSWFWFSIEPRQRHPSPYWRRHDYRETRDYWQRHRRHR